MTPYQRGVQDCSLDNVENAPFASIGGLNRRVDPTTPDYIKQSDRKEYLRGYTDQAKALYGDEWQGVQFEWKPALQINP
jgi:hypothetical protein